jgi:hypothetical protein
MVGVGLPPGRPTLMAVPRWLDLLAALLLLLIVSGS